MKGYIIFLLKSPDKAKTVHLTALNSSKPQTLFKSLQLLYIKTFKNFKKTKCFAGIKKNGLNLQTPTPAPPLMWAAARGSAA